MELQGSLDQYHRTKNPVHAFEIFVLAKSIGVAPPKLITDFIADVFDAYIQSNGKDSLDKLFGLSKGAGSTPPIKSYVLFERDQQLMRDVFILTEVFGCSDEEAVHMVARYLEDMKSYGHPIFTESADKISEATISDKYHKEWKKILKSEEKPGHIKSCYADESSKSTYLRLYPEDSIPFRLSRYIKKKTT